MVVVVVAVTGQGGVDVVGHGAVVPVVVVTTVPVPPSELLLLHQLPNRESASIEVFRGWPAASVTLVRLPGVAIVRVCALCGIPVAGPGPRLKVAREPTGVISVETVIVAGRDIGGLGVAGVIVGPALTLGGNITIIGVLRAVVLTHVVVPVVENIIVVVSKPGGGGLSMWR